MPYAASLIDWLAVLALMAALIAAALSDASTYLIPNRYSAAIAVAFVIYAIGKPATFWFAGLGMAALMMTLGALLFARGALGGGDVKLLAASALWAGLDQAALLLVATALAGGVLAFAQLMPLHYFLPARPEGASVSAGWRSKLHQPVPFGIAIAFGGICVALARLTF